MTRIVRRPFPPAFLGLWLLAAAPAEAQLAGRWALVLENGQRSGLRGELRLTEDGARLDGSLLLETRDGAWLAVAGTRGDGPGGFDLAAAGPEQIRLTGRVDGDGLEGEMWAGGGLRYRWRSTRLDPGAEFYPSLPRFLLRQIVVGAGAPAFRLPGPWLAAARAAGETTEAIRTRYEALARRAGLEPLERDGLTRATLLRAMGLLGRDRLREVMRQELGAIRDRLPGDTLRARFDYLFRPAGEWLVDLHDAALARARRPFPTLSWDAALPVLRAIGQAGPGPAGEAAPLAVYRLLALARTDSAAFAHAREQMEARDPQGARAVLALLQGYTEASEWYAEVMRFFLGAPWLDTPSGHRSLTDLVRSFWGDSLAPPAVEAVAFGYPEGSARAATNPAVLAAAVSPRNAPARDWLARHGAEGLLDVLGRLDGGFGSATTVSAGGERFQLSSLGEYRRQAFNGFLEPRDVIRIDPSYAPLLALGTLVHEWQHILHEHRRTARAVKLEGQQLTFTRLDPFLAEGLAEWAAEEILAPAAARFPLLALGEAEKRVSLGSDDTHVVGYLLVRTLARSLSEPKDVLALLVEHGSDPVALARTPVLRRAWSRFTGEDRVISRRGLPALLPETEFAIEDLVPEVVGRRILLDREP